MVSTLEHVDVRVKTFAAEVTSRLSFLCADYGFTGPEAVHAQDDDSYPVLRTCRYDHGDFAVEVSLTLSYMGEEYVTATLVSAVGPGAARRSQIGQGTAHTGYQMRRALDRQADAIRALVTGLPGSAE
jgi:hypothetical protein